ncbi:response regulator transcription factor [Labrenzia sp. VG12]|uniref:response regulator transcription factor n=1 Tax=Labrenzia sp. VG12 TaxID=2021862 RepID=UPI000B8BCC1A|nr:response regulator transcription factor [Labrenzia sp. VG12]ASP35317.1 DNA-binding response regulator [Labrenzia sp. VG12]
MRVLIVEDDRDLLDVLQPSLEAAGFLVDVALDGEEGEHLGEAGEHDVIILDLGLPMLDGLSVLKRWRTAGLQTPVLVLTARGTWRDKVDGLRGGADDYLTKPFETEELMARLEALIRRSHGHGSSQLTLHDLELDLSLKTVRKAGQPVNLTRNEYRAFAYLALNRGKVVSKTELTQHLYDQDFDRDSNVIEATMARLRKKIGMDVVRTKRGHGYYVS